MNEIQTIHNYKKMLEKVMSRIKEDEVLTPNNKASIEHYRISLINKGLSEARIIRLMEHCRKIGRLLGKNFEDANREDIERVVSELHAIPTYAFATVEGYKIAIKQFYKWLKGKDEEYPETVKWIKSANGKRYDKLPTDLITEEEVAKILNACVHPRDKCLISLLWETGARIGEIGTAQIGSLTFTEGEAELTIHGKTGWRKVLLISSVPYIKDWLKYHPSPNDKNSMLFTMLGDIKRDAPITYPAIAKMLRTTMKRANINKKTNPHLWRHSRATYLANYLTEAQLCSVLGWVVGSKEAGTYVHLSGRETNDAIRKLSGKPTKETKPTISQLTPHICPICNELNEPTEDICHKCNNPFTIKAKVERNTKLDNIEKKLALMEKVFERLDKTLNLSATIEHSISDKEAKKMLEGIYCSKSE